MTKKNLDALKLLNFVESSYFFASDQIRHKKILIAFSGGQDSTCLLTLFYILSQKWDFELGIVYCHHCWNNSRTTAVKIFQTLVNWNLPFYWVEAPDSKAVIPEQHARNWRYTAFAKVVKWGSYDLVLTGHSLSDYSETVLFNLLRGSGLKGFHSLKETQVFDFTKACSFSFKKKISPFFSFDDFYYTDLKTLQKKNFQSSCILYVKPKKWAYEKTFDFFSPAVIKLICKKNKEKSEVASANQNEKTKKANIYKLSSFWRSFQHYDELQTFLKSKHNSSTGDISLLKNSKAEMANTLLQNQSSLVVLRPLLKINRPTLFLLSQKLQLSIIYDSSNKDLSLSRNYLRKLIFPLLKKINPAVEENIFKFSQILHYYYDILGDLPCPPSFFDIFKP